MIRMVQMLEDGRTRHYVSGRLQIPLEVVNRLWRHFHESGGSTRRPGQVRKRINTHHQDHYLSIWASRNRQSTAKNLVLGYHKATKVTVSYQTARSRLHERGLRARRLAVRPILTRWHWRKGLDFAEEHIQWNRDQWAAVLFPNESKVIVSNNDRYVWV